MPYHTNPCPSPGQLTSVPVFQFFCSTSTHYLDLQPATEIGCTAFLSIASALPCGTLAAVVLGFKSRSDCGPSTIRIAKEVLEATSSECAELVGHYLTTAALLVDPPAPAQLPASDEEGDHGLDFQGDAWRAHQMDIRSPSASYNSVTLEFTDPRVEAAFAAEQNASMACRDAVGYIFGFVVLVFVLFVPQTKFNQPAAAEGVQVWRWAICHLPFCLIISKRTRPLYCRHREALLAYTFITGLLWNYHVQHYLPFLSVTDFSRPLFVRGYIWVLTLILIFQVRIRLLVPLILSCFAVDSTLLPKICSVMYPDVAAGRCIAAEGLKVGLIAVAAPLMMIWFVERRSRENFLRAFRDNQSNPN